MKENKTLEYKSEVTNSFLKTVSAYANFVTGVIKFGVSDNGEICGIASPEAACLDIENKINDSISPKPDYSLSINRRNNVITLTVSEGRHKPYFYKGKAYRRSDTATVEVDNIELKRLILEGCNMNYEELACKESKLNFEYFENKLIEKIGISALSEDMLRTFGFYDVKRKFNVAAALFADKNEFYGVDIARFGNSINEILDRETFEGMSILRQYDGAVTIYRRYYQLEIIEGIERKKVELIPEEAFREAIANALVHRTWDINSHIRISMHPDYIEIASPGGLPRGITKEEYLRGNISNLRNPIIGNMFFRMHYIEMFGTGIRRILDSYDGSSLKPEFDATENSIIVKLPVKSLTRLVTTNGQKVLDLISTGRILSSSEIADKLGWSKDKVIRVINSLKAQGYILAIGNGRGTKYVTKK